MHSTPVPPHDRLPNSANPSVAGFTIARQSRFWRVLDPKGQLVCLTVYKRGAKEVVRRLCG